MDYIKVGNNDLRDQLPGLMIPLKKILATTHKPT